MKTILVLVAAIGLSLGAPNVAPRGLEQDWADIAALVPTEEILDILRDHLKTDGAVANAVLYLQGDEWRALVNEIASNAAVQEFLEYSTEIGLPLRDLIERIRDRIQNAVVVAEPDGDASLRPVLDEVEAITPIDEIRALIRDKLENSADFQALFVRLSGDKARDLVTEIRNLPEVQRLAQRLRDLGVKIDEVLAFVFEFLGWA